MIITLDLRNACYDFSFLYISHKVQENFQRNVQALSILTHHLGLPLRWRPAAKIAWAAVYVTH